MTRVVFVIVIGFASGCFEDDGGHVTATWHLVSVAGGTASCPPGFGSAAVEVDKDPTFAACSAGTVTSQSIYGRGLGNDVFVEIVSDDHATPLARSPSSGENHMELEFAGDETFDGEILIDGGYFQLGWNLTAPTCADAGVVEIAVGTTPIASPVGTVTRFACDDQSARVALPPGRYYVTVSAVNAQHQVVGTRSVGEQVIADPSMLVPISDLGLISIP
jgi:hypothetical protein